MTAVSNASGGTPNLAIFELTPIPSVVAGGRESYNFRIINSGTAAVTVATMTNAYLSTNATLDSSDAQIGSFRTETLAAGQPSDSVTASTLIPAEMAPGTYYIIVVADASDAITNESSESDNSFARSFTVMQANHAPTITSNGGGDTAGTRVAENTTAVTTVSASDQDAATVFIYFLSAVPTR